jgi:hypothetical protein
LEKQFPGSKTAITTSPKAPNNTAEHVLSVPLPIPPNDTLRKASRQNIPRPNSKLGPPKLPLAPKFRPRLLRRRNDASLHATLRPRQTRNHLPRIPPPSRRDDRSRHRDQQNGPSASPVLRPDAGSEMGHQYGQLCEWGRLLSLQL